MRQPSPAPKKLLTRIHNRLAVPFRDPCYRTWKEGLLLPGKTNLEDSLLTELALYFSMNKEEVEVRCGEATALIAQEWLRRNPQSEEEVTDFYLRVTPEIYPFELMGYHVLHNERTPLDALVAMKYAFASEYRNCLDFGCGVGSHAIVFARNGFAVTGYDISREILNFAEWRSGIRGLNCEFTDNEDAIEPNRFDIVIAFDVLEHIPEPLRVLEVLSGSLKKGGILTFTIPEVYDPAFPIHISYFSDAMRNEIDRLGLLLIAKVWNGYIFQKCDPPVSNEGSPKPFAPIIKWLRYIMRRRKVQLAFQRMVQTHHWQKADVSMERY